jgi:hypothetical protein
VKQSFFEISDPLVRLVELQAEVTKLQIRGRDA